MIEIVADLTESYTNKESSSVSEDTANMLMEAVLYTIRENFTDENSLISLSEQNVNYKDLYKHGQIIIKTKLYQIKMLYEDIVSHFEDYGCKNYKDTVVRGIMGFLKRYDMKYEPQNHILTLDYPMLNGLPDECGVDRILTYLKGIQLEQQILANFDREAVIGVLAGIMPHYRTLYLDNICYVILRRCISCMAADRDVRSLQIFDGDEDEIRSYFEGDDLAKITLRMQGLIRIVLKNLSQNCQKNEEYFIQAAGSYATKMAYQMAGDVKFNLNEM